MISYNHIYHFDTYAELQTLPLPQNGYSYFTTGSSQTIYRIDETGVISKVITGGTGTSSTGTTLMQNGLNTYTGGTYQFPSVNVSALTINTLNASGYSAFNSLLATSLSGGTIFSGNTDLYSIFATIGSGAGTPIWVHPGTNTYTGGTPFLPSVNMSSATLANLSTSGTNTALSFSATSISGGTYFSGNTPLETIIRNISSMYSAGTGVHTWMQNGTNTYTGGTGLLPTVNITGANLNNIYVTGISQFTGSIFAATADTIILSAITSVSLFGPISSGGTLLETIIQNISAQYSANILIQNGTNTYTGGTYLFPTINMSSATLANLSISGSNTAFSFSATSISGGTYFSGNTPLETIIRNISHDNLTNNNWLWSGTNIYNSGVTGNVGIRTTNPQATLDIISNSGTTNAFRIRNSGNTFNSILVSNNILYLNDGNSNIIINGSALSAAGVAIGYSSSVSLRGTAIGYQANGGSDGVAIGYNVNVNTAGDGGIGLGNNILGGGYSFGKNISAETQSLAFGDNIVVGGSGPSNNNKFFFGKNIIDNIDNINTQYIFGWGIYSSLANNKPGMSFKSNNTNQLLIGYDFSDSNYSNFGTNWIGMFNGTPPSGQTNAIQIYATDISGSSAVHFRNESGIIRLFQYSSINTVQGLADALTSFGLLSSSTISIDTSTSTQIQNGTNTYTGGTSLLTTVNISSATLANLSVSGNANFFSFNATNISGETYFSGSTPLSTIISNIAATTPSSVVTQVQPGINTYTGGTYLFPTVNISAVTLVSLSATTISGGTIYSASTDIQTMFLPTTAYSGLTKITVSTIQPVAPSVGDLWIDSN